MTTRGQRGLLTFIALSGLAVWYVASTVAYVSRYPPLEAAQVGIVAPAHKLASQGVYGNDLYTGFYRTEERNYEYMPAYPLLVAGSFKLFGLGIIQARLVSVLCGLVVLLLTFILGLQLHGATVGLLAVGLLCFLRLGADPPGSGVLLIDFARVIRYDILVPVFVLLACSTFVWSIGHAQRVTTPRSRKPQLGFFFAGVAVGLATLSHLYGSFILPVLVLLLVWEYGPSTMRRPHVYLVLLGTALAVLPWVLYIAQDVEAYRGQMSRHGGRFDLLDPMFYVRNLLREPHRYGAWVEGFPGGLIRPRIGIWVFLLGIPSALVVLWQRVREWGRHEDRLTLIAFPTLALLMGALVSFKRHQYVLLLLPFVALLLACVAVHLWRQGGAKARRWVRFGVVSTLVLVLVEGFAGITRYLDAARQSSLYEPVVAAIATGLPEGARMVITNTYWLGLQDFETRSIDLAFVQSQTVPMARTLEGLGADYFVVDRALLERASAPPPDTASARIAGQWRQVLQHLEDRCPEVIRTVRDPTYGIIDIYACHEPEPGANSTARGGSARDG